MKKIAIFISIILASLLNLKSQDTKNQPKIEVFGNDHFSIVNQNETYFIDAEKEAWETLTIKVNNPEIYKEIPLDLIINSYGINNFSIGILQNSEVENKEIILKEGLLKQGNEHITLNLHNYSKNENDELLLILTIQKGEKWKGNFSIKASNYMNFNKDNKMIIYPNPCIDQFSVLCNNDKGNMQIINEQGIIEYSSSIETKDVINCKLKSGNYIVILTSENNTYKGKLNVSK